MTNTRSITVDSAHVRQNCMQDPLRPKAAPPALHAVPPSILLTLRGTVGSGSYLEQGSETELGLKCQRGAGLTQQNYSGTMAQTCSTKGLSNQGSVCSARSRQHAQGSPCEQGLREIPLRASAEYVSCIAWLMRFSRSRVRNNAVLIMPLRGLDHHHRQPHHQHRRHHHQQTGFAGGPGCT